MKYTDIHLPYFKQGDDLAHHLSQCKNIEEALEAHAKQLEYAADVLRSVKNMIAGQNVEIDADSHIITVSGPDEIIEALIDANYGSRTFDDEDEGNEVVHENRQRSEGWDSIF